MTDDPHARVMELLQAHGTHAVSSQVLAPGYRYWWHQDTDCVAYVDTGGAWVAAGAPLAPAERQSAVALAFCCAARDRGRRACFFAVEAPAPLASALRTVPVGLQPQWDPRTWPDTLRQHRGLREQLRRARAKDVAVRCVPAAELLDAGQPTRRAVEDLVARWTAGRAMAPMGFLVAIHPLDHAAHRRCYVASRNGRAVGFLSALPVVARNGWFVEHLLRHPQAPNGTAELLLDALLRDTAAEGSPYATLGLCPLAGTVGPWLSILRDHAASLYDFRGLYAFKSRLHPVSWTPVLLAHPPETSSAVAFHDVLVAFAGGSLVRFALASLVRGPAVVIRALALGLLPWGLVLVTAPARYFPSPWVRLAWLSVALALAVTLSSLAIRWRPAVARVSAATVAAVALLSAVQAAAWNLRHTHGLLEPVLLAGACATACLATVVLQGARARHDRIARGPETPATVAQAPKVT